MVNYWGMELHGWHGEVEFQCQIGLGFNLYVVPPQDCGALISGGQGFIGMEVRRSKMVLELTWS